MADKQVTINPESGEVLSLEDMPDAFGTLIGTEEQLSFDLGSEYALTTSTLKVSSIDPIHITGQFVEGDRVRVEVEVEVEHLAFPPLKHRGFRVGTERRHFAEVVGVHQLP